MSYNKGNKKYIKLDLLVAVEEYIKLRQRAPNFVFSECSLKQLATLVIKECKTEDI